MVIGTECDSTSGEVRPTEGADRGRGSGNEGADGWWWLQKKFSTKFSEVVLVVGGWWLIELCCDTAVRTDVGAIQLEPRPYLRAGGFASDETSA